MENQKSFKKIKYIIKKYLKNNKKIKKYIKYKIVFIISCFLLLIFFKIQKININKNIKICLCVIGKNENLYVKEFVDHYKKIGYDKIFIYDNNDINGEKFEEVIKNEIDNNFVSIINYRGLKGKDIRPQFNAYKDCYEKNQKNYDWLSFYDVDEFLVLQNKYITIKEFLNKKIFKKCDNVKINWVLFHNIYSLYYENKPLQIRFPNPIYNNEINKHIKSTVRGKASINYWYNMYNPHSSHNNITACSSSGKIVDSSSPYISPPDIYNAFIKHYSIKSFEEYCNKIKKSRSDLTSIENKIEKERIINILYNQNKNNNIKLNIIKKTFNIT